MTEINGKPAAKVFVSVKDVINIGNFQNVTVEYGAERWVEDDDDVIIEAHKNLAENVIEPALAEQREQILNAMAKA